MKIKESHNVTFDETPPQSKTSPLVYDDLDEEEAIKVIKKKNLENDIEDETLEFDKILVAPMVRDIDGKMVGKDGKPLRTAIRMPTVSNPKFGPPLNTNPQPNEVKTNEDNPIIEKTQEGEPKSVLENVQVKLTGWNNVDNSGIKSFANVVSASKPMSKLNFRTLLNEDKVEETDFVLPLAAVEVVKHKFDNTLVGFFVGQKVTFPLVKNYIMNTWSKFGVQKVMRDDEGVHYFMFDSTNGVD
ncbi:hypothetical protein Tco_0908360 [Tanacetum coccineum]|uniref:DUF4283 domain-containing protein n=1 Tax=Tanacetum coccineum TaxID=301880 RepID=A0ABQ5CM49_9ASTR